MKIEHPKTRKTHSLRLSKLNLHLTTPQLFPPTFTDIMYSWGPTRNKRIRKGDGKYEGGNIWQENLPPKEAGKYDAERPGEQAGHIRTGGV